MTAPSPPLSRSLPDLAAAFDDLDGLDDLPDRPPSPQPRVELGKTSTGHQHTTGPWDGEGRDHSYWGQPHEHNGIKRRDEELYGREHLVETGEQWRDVTAAVAEQARIDRSPSIGSIHSAPELAGPPSPRELSSERPAQLEESASRAVESSPPTSPTFSEPRTKRKRSARSPSTLWDYLQEEVRAERAEAVGFHSRLGD